jgi:uncharacterized protein YndB with AHSA1/START domain
VIRVRDTFVIDRPVDLVFRYVANMENLPTWAKGVESSRHLSGGEPRQGSRFAVTGKMGPRRMTVTYEMLEFEPNRRFRARGDFGPFRFEEEFTFTGERSSTRVTQAADMQPKGAASLIAPVAGVILSRQMRGDNRRAKRLLEQLPVE